VRFLERVNIKGSAGIIHFVGMGGIGMSGIAEIMIGLGYSVQGSDLSSNSNTERLKALGAKIFCGHEAANVINADYVVISSAITAENKEVQEALHRGIPVIRRAEMLAELMRFKTSIAISGSHGKTTTTSLMACMFEAAGLSPTVINGGILNNKSTNAYLGKSEYLIAEADESDATFIKIPSTIAVITNIDPEHMDYYKTFENLIAAFESFITNLPFYGFAVVCLDHPIVRDITSRIIDRKIITYGIESEDVHVRAYNIRTNLSSSTYDLRIKLPHASGSVVIENVTLPTPGIHNVLNSLSVIAVAAELDFGVRAIREGFKDFQGVKRRFTKTGEHNGVTIIDDYAHHPIEIAATLASARSVVGKAKLIAVFQPHRYSRVEFLFDDFTKCFSDADKVYVTDIYGAGEEAIEGITGEALAEKMKSSHKNVEFLKSHEDLPRLIRDEAKRGDMVLMMGAGSVTNWAAELPDKLAAL